MKEVPLFLNEKYSSHGIIKWITWDMEQAPSAIVVGQSGSGKTYACIQILAQVSRLHKCLIFVCDYKSDRDFEFLSGTKNYYRFTTCREGLRNFYRLFKGRQEGTDNDRTCSILLFDEWSSYCNSGEKKEIEEDKKILGILVSMGRSFNCHVIISQQRADSIYFAQYRDNFSLAIGVSNLSIESRKMVFPDYASSIPPDRSRGCGYLAFNGQEPIPFIVPRIRNMRVVEHLLREATNR